MLNASVYRGRRAGLHWLLALVTLLPGERFEPRALGGCGVGQDSCSVAEVGLSWAPREGTDLLSSSRVSPGERAELRALICGNSLGGLLQVREKDPGGTRMRLRVSIWETGSGGPFLGFLCHLFVVA